MTDGLLLIPAYNEERNISKVLRDIKEKNTGMDILVVNDGSMDRTCETAEKQKVKVISHSFNLGYGAALQTGFKYAMKLGYRYIIQFDADGQHDPRDICTIKNEIEKKDENIDIVIGSRYIEKDGFKTGFLKMAVIRAMRFLIRRLTGCRITDPTSGLKALSKRTFEYYSRIGNFPNDYPDADILIKMLRKNYRASEVPIHVREREYGVSMHSGLKPIFYVAKEFLNILVILLSEQFAKEN